MLEYEDVINPLQMVTTCSLTTEKALSWAILMDRQFVFAKPTFLLYCLKKYFGVITDFL